MSPHRFAVSVQFLRTEKGFWTVFWTAALLALGDVAEVPAIAPIGLFLALLAMACLLVSFKIDRPPSTRNAEDLYTSLFGLPGILILSISYFYVRIWPDRAENAPSLLIEVPFYGGGALILIYVLLISVVNRTS